MELYRRQWFAIHTKPRQEEIAAENLLRQDFEIYLPKIEQAHRYRGSWRHGIDPLFPRYLFIRLALGHDNTASIRSTRGVTRLVTFNGQPASVPDHLIEALQESSDAETGLHFPLTRLLEQGSAVMIVDGPLTGLEAIYQAQDGEARSIILLNILGKTQEVKISRDHLLPAHLA